MERWQSRHEHRVDFNLSDSGVHPLRVDELLEMTGESLGEERLAYVQTNGSHLLRRRIAALYPDAGPEEVLVTTGGAEANFLATWELVRPGDRVAVVTPTYGQTPGLARWLGAEVEELPLRESLGWQPDAGAARKIIGPGTRLVVVTNPNNPTGAILSGESRREIVDAASRVGAWILADEVYRGAEHSGEETASLWGRYDRLLVSHSLSKAYGLPGLRLGWLVGPPGRVERLWARKDYTTIAPAALSNRLGALALDPEVRPRLLSRTRRILQRNMDRLARWLDGHPETFEYFRPDAGAICWVRYQLDLESGELAERLRRDRSVLVVPGSHFGMDGYLRLGFGNPAAELTGALDRMADLVDAIGTRG